MSYKYTHSQPPKKLKLKTTFRKRWSESSEIIYIEMIPVVFKGCPFEHVRQAPRPLSVGDMDCRCRQLSVPYLKHRDVLSF